MKRQQCPDCPDGSVWTKKGPTNEICPTCRGEAFVWVNDETDEDDSAPIAGKGGEGG